MQGIFSEFLNCVLEPKLLEKEEDLDKLEGYVVTLNKIYQQLEVLLKDSVEWTGKHTLFVNYKKIMKINTGFAYIHPPHRRKFAEKYYREIQTTSQSLQPQRLIEYRKNVMLILTGYDYDTFQAEQEPVD